MLLTQLLREREQLEESLTVLTEEYLGLKNKLTSEIAQIGTEIEQCNNGLDVDKIKLAETVIRVTKSSYTTRPKVEECIKSAIRKIVEDGGGTLWKEYIGLKDYAHWSDQRSDHPYCMGPKHGDITFRIGLTDSVLSRDPQVLTYEEIDAVAYYLTFLGDIIASEKSAAESV